MPPLRALALHLLIALATLARPALAKPSTEINVPTRQELYASIGDVLVRVDLLEPERNALGIPDLFGRKKPRGYTELRYMGLAPDGRAVFRRRAVDTPGGTPRRAKPDSSIETIETPELPQVRQTTALLPRRAVDTRAGETIEFALDLKRWHLITIEDRLVDVRAADGGGVRFVVGTRSIARDR